MADTDRPAAGGLEDRDDPRDQLAASARGWHRIQVAVLGFIGFCGIFWSGDSVAGAPGAQWVLMALVALAFALAIVAIFLVGRVAYPVDDPAQAAGTVGASTPGAHARRLGTGIRLTYLALALVVAATLSAWLPASPDDGAVVVGDATGQTWCGSLVQAPAGEARLATADGPVRIPLDRVALLRPVGDC